MQNSQQGKVSMVVPCYNKEKYIGAMLDSVLTQEWDNIELLLVNDGSTDGTRYVIVSYLPKFEQRGYEVKIFDQENGGCCKAVHTGLVNMTGDYYCLVDADDEIEPQYVSKMAGWLDKHDEYEWAACGYKSVNVIDGKRYVNEKTQHPFPQDCDNLLTHYIFRRVITMVWIYMIRKSYMDKCGMIDNFCTERSTTYEPLIMVPPAAHGGRIKFFDEPLYGYNVYASDLFGFDSLEKAKSYHDDYLRMYDWAIARLNIGESDKKRYSDMARLSYQLELFKQLPQIMRAQSHTLAVQTRDLINRISKSDNIHIDVTEFSDRGYDTVFRAIENRYLKNEKVFKRIIGYGALGKSAFNILPRLVGSQYCPNELWDKNGDGYRVKLPDFNSLTADDLIIVFPTKKEFVSELAEILHDCPATVYFKNEIDYLLAELKYPQLSRFEV